jgi:hypothetical protein
MDLMTRADMERGMKDAAQAAGSAVQAATESMVRGLANGVSYIALEEWTMQVSCACGLLLTSLQVLSPRPFRRERLRAR